MAKKTCPSCNGTGKHVRTDSRGKPYKAVCDRCGGTGEIEIKKIH